MVTVLSSVEESSFRARSREKNRCLPPRNKTQPGAQKTQNRKRAANKIEHVVRSGESFWTISRKYGVTTRQLSAWNGMAPRDPLPIGRKLVVWTNQSVADTPRMSPTAALGNTTRKVRYTVKSGDSLYWIARKFRVGIDQIVRWNNIDKNKILRPGQRLTMYVDVTRQSS